MTQLYSRGALTWACCDNCGWRYRYQEMQETSYHSRVCRRCFDGDYDLYNHPQNTYPQVDDAESLEHPRPDEPFT